MVTQESLLTLLAKLALTIVSVNLDKSWECCNGENKIKHENSRLLSVQLMPGVREKINSKDSECPYQEPTLVPLDEKSKV